MTYTGSKGIFDSNFAAVMGHAASWGADPTKLREAAGKKDEWYRRWGTAALQSDAGAARAQFAPILAELKSAFEDKSQPGNEVGMPGQGGGKLYSGYADRGLSGRQRAEADTAAPAAQSEKRPDGSPVVAPGGQPQAGTTHRTLEQSLIGNLFDGVTRAPAGAAPDEKKKYIPSVKEGEWWNAASANYASQLAGEVNVFLDLGMPWFVSKYCRDHGGKAAVEANPGQLSGLLAVPPDSVFRSHELPELVKSMASPDARVTGVNVHLRVGKRPGATPVESTVSVPASAGKTLAGALGIVNSRIASLVSMTDLSACLAAAT
jgi:hypothetical protein